MLLLLTTYALHMQLPVRGHELAAVHIMWSSLAAITPACSSTMQDGYLSQVASGMHSIRNS
jgi:hypothetical protein